MGESDRLAKIEGARRSSRRLSQENAEVLLPMTGPVPARTVRRYVAALRAAGASKEAFRPRLAVESWAALNAAIVTELEADFSCHFQKRRSRPPTRRT